MAYFTLSTTSIRRYGTSKQDELLAMLNDPSVHIRLNEILIEKMNEGDYVPFNFSDYIIHTPGDYPGRLRQSAKATENGITWRTPYARYVWGGEVYGKNYPIFAKGDTKREHPIGFYSKRGVTKTPTGEPMNYTVDNAGPRWIDRAFAESGRVINNAITNQLKKECRKRRLNT